MRARSSFSTSTRTVFLSSAMKKDTTPNAILTVGHRKISDIPPVSRKYIHEPTFADYRWGQCSAMFNQQQINRLTCALAGAPFKIRETCGVHPGAAVI